MVNIGGQLNKVLKLKGISLEQLSERSGVSMDVLKNIEANSMNIKVAELHKITEALNITFEIGDSSI